MELYYTMCRCSRINYLVILNRNHYEQKVDKRITNILLLVSNLIRQEPKR